jgi:hypothetical protein
MRDPRSGLDSVTSGSVGSTCEGQAVPGVTTWRLFALISTAITENCQRTVTQLICLREKVLQVWIQTN